jgi:hypothetical protein
MGQMGQIVQFPVLKEILVILAQLVQPAQMALMAQ